MEHDPDGGKGDDSLGGIAAFLIILGHAPSPTQRFEGSFDHPAARTEDEATTSDATDDEKRQPEQETLGIDGNVTFAALDLLNRAEASRLPFPRLDAFAQGLAGAIIANQPARQAVTPGVNLQNEL